MTPSIVWILAACNSGLAPVATVPVTTAPTDTDTEPTLAEPDYAGEIQISKVSLYQGVEVPLVVDGEEPTSLESPVVAGRPGLLRVFLDPKPKWEPRRVNVILTVRNGDDETVLEEKLRIEEESVDDDLDTTVNFDLTGDLITSGLELVVEVREVDTDEPGGGKIEDAKWRSEATGGLNVEVTDELVIAIIPVRYNADGSGRLPDTSPSQIDRIQTLMTAMYPASTVTVRVDPVLDWNAAVNPFSSWQWSALLEAINEMRDGANETPNTYYYGMFNGDDSLTSYCQAGCILGMSLLAFSANDDYFRASVGVGFPGTVSSETLAHEVGHAHGREHAPCGLYGQPSDPSYPYDDAEIGSWGYHILDGRLFTPTTYVDFMSYCSPTWISDYTYSALAYRIKTVGGQARAATTRKHTLRVLEDGVAVPGGQITLATTTVGDPVELSLVDGNGLPAGSMSAQFFPYDHIDGGLVVIDAPLPEGFTALVDRL